MCGYTVITCFGTWNKGLSNAGLEPRYRQYIPKEECISELRRMAKMLGHAPTRLEFDRHASMSSGTVSKYFDGSWNKGLVAAGLDVKRNGKVLKSECLIELRRVSQQLGHTPTCAEFDKHARISTDALERVFGSWNKSLIAAGLKINHSNAAVTKSACVLELSRVTKKLGHTPTKEEFYRHASMSSAVVHGRFGTWNKGLIAAGLIPVKRMNITKVECISELRRMAKQLGRAPKRTEFNEHAAMTTIVICRHFGSWNRGLAAAGLDVRFRWGISKSECISELRRVAKQVGHAPTFAEFTKHANLHAATAQNLFGTWNKGLKAAGLTPRKAGEHL